MKIEIEKGNNDKQEVFQDKNKADTEEASKLLLEEFFLDRDHDDDYVGK